MDEIRTSILARIHHYRSQDSHECKLLNARVTWLMIIQSALIISFFLVSISPPSLFVFLSELALFFFALFFAHTISKAVRKAELIIYDWHMKERKIHKEIQELKDNRLVQELEDYLMIKNWEIDINEEKRGADVFSFQRSMFPAILLLWTVFAALSCYNFFEYKIHENIRNHTEFTQ